MIKRQCL